MLRFGIGYFNKSFIMPTKQEMEDQTLEFLDCLDSRLETLEICLDVWLESITLLESLNKMSQLKLGYY